LSPTRGTIRVKGAEVETVFSAIRRTGLVPRGAVSLAEGERIGELADMRTIVLAGMVGVTAGTPSPRRPRRAMGLLTRSTAGAGG
jgi:hypothetical protein